MLELFRRLLGFVDTAAGAILGFIIFPIISITIGSIVWLGLALAASVKLLNVPFQFIKAFFQEDSMSWRKAGQLALMLGVGVIELAALYFLWPLAQDVLEVEALWLSPLTGLFTGLRMGVSGLLMEGAPLNELSRFYSIASNAGLLSANHINMYARLLNWLSLRILNTPIMRDLLPMPALIGELAMPDAHPLFEVLHIEGGQQNTPPLSAAELRRTQAQNALSATLAKYHNLNARLVEVARIDMLPEAQKPRDELTREAISRPILLFKEIQIDGEWQPLNGSTQITDHHNITQHLLLSSHHPLNHEDIFNPGRHEGHLTRYRWNEYTDYSAELEHLKAEIRLNLAAAQPAVLAEEAERPEPAAAGLHFFNRQEAARSVDDVQEPAALAR